MENEENKGLINKNDFQDQLVPFVSSFLELSHYSLSLILLDTQIFLGEIQHCAKEEESKQRKDKERKENKKLITKEQDLKTSIGIFASNILHV